MFSSVSWSHLMSTIGHFSVLVRIKLIFRSKWLASCSKVAGQFYIYTVFSILFYSFHFIEFHFDSFHWIAFQQKRSRSRLPEFSFRIAEWGLLYTIFFYAEQCILTWLARFYYRIKYNHLIKVWCDQNYNDDG